MNLLPLIEHHLDVRGFDGTEATVLCPFHEDRSPSMSVNVTTGLWVCHGCGERGNLKTLAAKLGFGNQVSAASLDLLRERTQRIRDDSYKPVEDFQVLDEGILAEYDFETLYWQSRGLSDEAIARFQLGYSPEDDAATIPMRDRHGDLLGVTLRYLDGSKPKYKNPKGYQKARHLFGAWLIEDDQRSVALVEGEVDAICCWSARIPALALGKATISEHQVETLMRLGVFKVVLMLDNDEAGTGFPEHELVPVRRRSGGVVCDICGNRLPKGRQRRSSHPATGVFQVREALQGTGLEVSVGVYRNYWFAKDPGDLKPAQIRKLFHSAVPWHKWQQTFNLTMLQDRIDNG